MKSNHQPNESFQKERENSNTIFKIYFFFLGLMNNSTYVVILSASKSLVKQFKKDSYLSLFSGCLILFSFFIRTLNLVYLVRIKHKNRIRLACFGYRNYQSFLSCLFGTILIGTFCSLGDATIQGYLKAFEPETVSGFSMGTGFAGVYGSVYWLLMEYLGFTVTQNLAFMILIYFAYYIVFASLVRKKIRIEQIILFQNKEEKSFEKDTYLEEQIEFTQQHENEEAEINEIITFSNISNVLKFVKYYAINLGLVYFFEYSIITFITNVISNRLIEQNFWQKNSFFIFQILYQVGVFMGRSTLSIMRIPQLQILTLLQFTMYITTILFAYFSHMLITGIIGGLAFINCLYGIYSDQKIIQQKKEVSTTVNSMFCDTGILMNSLTGLLYMKFLFNN